MALTGLNKSKKVGYDLYQIPELMMFHFGRPRGHHWASVPMLMFLIDLSLSWTGKKIGLGDISLDTGAAPPTHVTHKQGTCVDLYVFHLQNLQRVPQNPFKNVSHMGLTDVYDKKSTVELARTIVRVLDRGYHSGQFLSDDPDVRAVSDRITTTGKGHADHFHIELHNANPHRGKEAARLAQARIQFKCGF